MDVRIFDLDGGVISQAGLAAMVDSIWNLRAWGPTLRMACSWRRFQRFGAALAGALGTFQDAPATMTFLGSGDFHHLSLELIRRLSQPCNLLVLDNHPDWMHGIPVLHCGTWLYHAARLPHVAQVFHVGGDMDFDNSYTRLAPWSLLRSGKIVTLPARRCFGGEFWSQINHRPLRKTPESLLTSRRLGNLLQPYQEQLRQLPLYISLDRDVLTEQDALVNWDSGYLRQEEVVTILTAFRERSAGILGMDVVGDWSPVHVQGLLRRLLHWCEHPKLGVTTDQATRQNEPFNLELVEFFRQIATPEKLGVADPVTCTSAGPLPVPREPGYRTVDPH